MAAQRGLIFFVNGVDASTPVMQRAGTEGFVTQWQSAENAAKLVR